MIHRIGDRGRHPDDADLAEPLQAERIAVVRLVDEDHLDVVHVGVHRHVVFGDVGVHDAAEAVIDRLARVVDKTTLFAVLKQPLIDLSEFSKAEASAQALSAILKDEAIVLRAEYNEASESCRIIIQRNFHGNVQISAIDKDFVESGDFEQIVKTAGMLHGLISAGASVKRGEKETKISEFKQALDWLLEDVQRNLAVQRYKGLGEMNPSQLWETTMDPKVRRLLKVQIDDAISADEIFTTLMGDIVEPRRAFIENNALVARNIDI